MPSSSSSSSPSSSSSSSSPASVSSSSSSLSSSPSSTAWLSSPSPTTSAASLAPTIACANFAFLFSSALRLKSLSLGKPRRFAILSTSSPAARLRRSHSSATTTPPEFNSTGEISASPSPDRVRSLPASMPRTCDSLSNDLSFGSSPRPRTRRTRGGAGLGLWLGFESVSSDVSLRWIDSTRVASAVSTDPSATPARSAAPPGSIHDTNTSSVRGSLLSHMPSPATSCPLTSSSSSSSLSPPSLSLSLSLSEPLDGSRSTTE
mmetsp:Transcript_12262/g.47636  ORF Transcript_12262/g.47636 Transcript_12262/m.47636 type:complete len:262 (+) Transcript_12262:1120-1905(+)